MSLFGDDATTLTESSVMEQLEVGAVETESEEVVEEIEAAEEVEEVEKETTETDSHEEQSELIGGKFKSTEDLLKAYQNLQSQFTKERQQSKQQQEQPQQRIDPDEYTERILDAFQRDPAGTINYLVQQQLNSALAPIQQERQLDSLTKNFDVVAKEYTQLHSDEGMGQLFQKIQEIADEFGNPELVRNPSQRVVKMAAQELWGGETKAKVYQSAMEKGRQQAEEMRRAKQGVAVQVTQKPKEQPKNEADLIRDGIISAGVSGGLFD